MPVGQALEWCGWLVRGFDIERTPSCDLLDPKQRSLAASEAAKADAVMVAMDCSTLSRARERPIPGVARPPQPLRDAAHVWGLPNLGERDAKRVADANILIQFTADVAQAGHRGGAGVVLENPRRAWYWHIPEIAALLDLPGWQDVDYMACCLGAARAKQQRLRTNVDELSSARGECRHTHDKHEWQPYKGPDGHLVYPTKLEQEYTAELAFHIAIALSLWAVRVRGYKMNVPKPPPVQETGDRCEWLQWPGGVMRQDALVGLGVRLQCPTPCRWAGDPTKGGGIPTLVSSATLSEWPSHAVYIGPGHLKFKQARTEWSSQFTPGPDGSRDLCVRRYAAWLAGQSSQLRSKWARTLRGRLLVCECKAGQPCHGEVLVALVAQHLQDSGGVAPVCAPRGPRLEGRRSRSPAPWRRRTSQLVAGAPLLWGRAMAGVCAPVPVAWPQAAVDAAVRRLYPPEWLDGVPMPCLEDLLSEPTFCAYREWQQHEGLAFEDPGAERKVSASWVAWATGLQRGALASKHAAPPLLGYGLSKDEHFRIAAELACGPAQPWQRAVAADNDLRFAAAQVVRRGSRPAEAYAVTAGVFRELARRCRSLTLALRKRQPTTVRKVTDGLNLGLIGVLAVVLEWPDWQMPRGFVSGFPLVGTMPRTHIFDPVATEPQELDLAKLREQGPGLRRALASRPVSPEVQFLWDSVLDEVKAGKAFDPMTEAEVSQYFGTDRWCAVPSFCHVQPCGKKRRIDDAKCGQQNAFIEYSERGHLCTAFQPALCARLVSEEADAAGVDAPTLLQGVTSGCDDLPNAFRAVPGRPEDLWANVVAVRHPQSGEWLFQIVWALLFGLASSVIQFGRWSHFLQAVMRRIGGAMWSMYVDDGVLIDAACAQQSGQDLASEFFAALGSPLAPHKRKCMAAENDFLGVRHDLSDALGGSVKFWARQALHDKCQSMLDSHRAANRLTPAESSKLVGTLGFLAQAAFGRVATAAFNPLYQRMHSDRPPWALSNSILQSFEFLQVLLRERPQRVVHLKDDGVPPLVVASDAQADHSVPSGGYLLFDPVDGRKSAGWAPIWEPHLRAWGFTVEGLAEGANPIQCCEAAFLPWALVHEGFERLRGRRILWFVDNTSALYAAVKGSSRHPAVARAIAVAHYIGFHWGLQFWFEFIESDANWADGISRDGPDDVFVAKHGFQVQRMRAPTWPWVSDLQSQWQAVSELRWGRVPPAVKRATVGRGQQANEDACDVSQCD